MSADTCENHLEAVTTDWRTVVCEKCGEREVIELGRWYLIVLRNDVPAIPTA